MTIFAIVCAAMLAAALAWVLLPLFRKSGPEPDTARNKIVIALAVLFPVVAVGMYGFTNTWDWDAAAQGPDAQAQSMDSAMAALEARLAKNPEDVESWLLLGRSYMALGQPARSVDAYQKAYDLTKGENIDATVGLGEALALTDEAAMTGRAGVLFTEALRRDPNNPKALWYGGVAALRGGDLKLGRDRFQMLLAQNPPPEIREIVERQIQDLNQQLGETTDSAKGEGTAPAAAAKSALPPSHPPIAGGAATPAASPAATPGTPPSHPPVAGGAPAAKEAAGPAAAGGKTLRVAISIAPELKKQLTGDAPMFIIARDPAGGPPLAVQRRTASAAPLTVEFREDDAMVAGRSIGSVPRVQVTARLSRSGTPQAQSGDFYGEATHELGKDNGTLNIIIDRTVP